MINLDPMAQAIIMTARKNLDALLIKADEHLEDMILRIREVKYED